MPKIELKPNSPEYNDDKPSSPQFTCDFEGCDLPGDYKAPKTRQGAEYYHFCLDHVREYNSSWNFFDGMSNAQIQEEMLRSLYGDRPTWRHEGAGSATDNLKRAAWRTYNGFDENSYHNDKDETYEQRRQTAFAYHHSSPEYQAMALMGLEPPLDLDIIKKRYKELAMKHHPDRNKGSEEAAERLKSINAAYTALKAAFEKYEKILDQDE